MAIPGNWLVGDPGHVDEHNRIYQDLASKLELYNALEDLQYSAPLHFGDVPPEDEGAIWIDTSEDWYPFPEGNASGDILVVNEPNEKLSVEWIPGSTYARMEVLSIPFLSGVVSDGDIETIDFHGMPALEFPKTPATIPTYSLSPVWIPDNWTELSFHVYWANTGTNEAQSVRWRMSRRTPVVDSSLSGLTTYEMDGPSNELTLDAGVLRKTQIGGTYSRPSDGVFSLSLQRLTNLDTHSDPAVVLGIELRKEG